MLNWANRFSIFSFLDNNGYNFLSPEADCILAVGCKTSIVPSAGKSFEGIQQFIDANKGQWIFGHLGYDLKNETENLVSRHEDHTGFFTSGFFVPEHVIVIKGNYCHIVTNADAEFIYHEINNPGVLQSNETVQPLFINTRFTKTEYVHTINQLKKHIQRGDCYEINFCQEFYAEDVSINPSAIFQKLNSISPNPFSACYKWEHSYCLCASPERFLKKQGSMLYSQPIKGTSKTNPGNKQQDEAAKQYLQQSQKEKSENVMVVDLVRNDLSRFCKKGTVKATELFGIYSFPQVHQMISTIRGEVDDAVQFTDIIKATFPMGSMTGAPKKRVMELIEQYERSGRGLFSGSIGYINPDGDFDFNVVIRSIFYNEQTRYLSFQTGSGITIYSDAEKEYEECLLKAGAIRKALE